MKTLRTLTTTLLAAVVIAGCGNGDSVDAANTDATERNKVLMDADSPEMKKQAPAAFMARFDTNKGAFVIAVERKLSPHGADRFYNLVRNGYFDGNKFFRVLPGFIVQWGMNGDPAINKIWSESRILDDPVQISNKKGTITFAKPGSPNARSTHLFINYADNTNLDGQGFAPFGHVSEGMEVVEAINSEYKQAPNQGMISEGGNGYLNEHYPNLDTILSAKIVD
ncbi:MAG: peptidylprolyl isomerase [Candidatus Latescibacterota bacterium]